MNTKEITEFWNSKILSNGGSKPIEYEKTWYCIENKILHHNLKSTLNCKYCNKEHE